MLTSVEFSALVNEADALARRSPLAYRLRVALLAALGFGFVIGSVLLALALGVALIVLVVVTKSGAWLAKVVWIPFAFAWVLIRSLWVRLTPPVGRELDPKEYPLLFREIDEVRRRVRAQRIDRVLLTPDFNASVASVPRLGLLGWPRNYLMLGLPMLASLSVPEFRSVIAHEFGHLARNHARFSNWIYRLRLIWSRIQAEFEHREGGVAGVFRRFLGWYAPYFNAYSFVLARGNEYEADAESVRVVGSAVAAQALSRVYVRSTALDRDFWSPLYGRADVEPEPPAAPYTRLLQAARDVDGETASAYLELALAARTGLDDTHPALSDRLAAMNAEVELGESHETSAAEALLASLLPQLTAEIDGEWQRGVSDWWHQRHEAHRLRNERVEELDRAAGARELSSAELWEYASSTEDARGAAAALPLYRRLIVREPDHAAACFAVGRLLLGTDEAAGIDHLERAMRADPAAVIPASQLLYRYFWSRQNYAEADRYLENLNAEEESARRDRIARSGADARDEFLPHGLEATELTTAIKGLASHERVRSAWIVRKQMPGGDHGLPHFIVLVRLRGMVFRELKTLQEIADRCELPGSLIVLSRSSAPRKLSRKLRRTAGSPVFERCSRDPE